MAANDIKTRSENTSPASTDLIEWFRDDGGLLSTNQKMTYNTLRNSIKTFIGLSADDFTATGDILVGTGAGTFTALGVGTNGQVLTSNSVVPGGIEWGDSNTTFLGLSDVNETTFTGKSKQGVRVAYDESGLEFTNNSIAAGIPAQLNTIGEESGNNTFLFRDGAGNLQGFVSNQADQFGHWISEKLTPVTGDRLVIEDSADGYNKKFIQIGNLPAAGGSVPTPTAIGDMLYSADGATWTKLAIGSDNEVLTVNVNVPNWEPATGGSLPSPSAIGKLLVTDSSATSWVENNATNLITSINFDNSTFIVTGNEGVLNYDGSNNRLSLLTATNTPELIPTQGDIGVTIQYEGTPLATLGTTLNFVGAGVTATGTGSTKTITIPGGGGASPLTTKGDLYTFSTVDDRLPVSAIDNAILMTRSAASTGLAWQTATGGAGDLLVGRASGGFFILGTGGAAADGKVLTANSADADGMSWETPAGLPTPSAIGKVLITNSALTGWVENDAINKITSMNFDNSTFILTGAEGVLNYDGTNNRLSLLTATNTPELIPTMGDIPEAPVIKYKIADESISSTTTRQQDDHLSGFPITTGNYLVEGELTGISAASGGFNASLALITSTGSSSPHMNTIFSTSATAFANAITNGPLIVNNAGALNGGGIIKFSFVFEITGTGTMELQWAQNTSNATSTTLYHGSWIKITKIA